ncbi:hypothetical protein SprV_0602175100 [Sparganum proliferum]
MVPKAAIGALRPCGEHRALNNVLVPYRNPVPHLQDFADAAFGKSVFSKVNLVRDFHQIPIALEDVSETAITIPFGLFEFLRMPYGLSNASQTFQRLVDSSMTYSLSLSPDIDLAEMAVGQRRAGSSCDEDVSGLQLQDLPLTTGNATILCDTSTTSDSPFVPPSLSDCLSSDEDVPHPTRNLQGRHDHGPSQNYCPGHCWTSPVVPYPLLPHLPSSLFLRPVYSVFHHVRYLQLPSPNQPAVLHQLHALTLPLYLLCISPAVSVMLTSLTV